MTALDAVQHLSFGSGKLHNPNNVDDIMIANNIASCATGNNAESYNYSWKWQDAAPPQAAKMDKRTPSTISFRVSYVLSYNVYQLVVPTKVQIALLYTSILTFMFSLHFCLGSCEKVDRS